MIQSNKDRISIPSYVLVNKILNEFNLTKFASAEILKSYVNEQNKEDLFSEEHYMQAVRFMCKFDKSVYHNDTKVFSFWSSELDLMVKIDVAKLYTIPDVLVSQMHLLVIKQIILEIYKLFLKQTSTEIDNYIKLNLLEPNNNEKTETLSK